MSIVIHKIVDFYVIELNFRSGLLVVLLQTKSAKGLVTTRLRMIAPPACASFWKV